MPFCAGMLWISGACPGGRDGGRAARSLSRLAVRDHAPADHGRARCSPISRHSPTRWPTVEALAAADEGEVMAAWAGLGYYARARNLLACARDGRGRAWRALPRHRGGAAQAARDRRLHRRGDRRDRLRPAGGGGRRQCRAGRRPAVRGRDAAAGGAATRSTRSPTRSRRTRGRRFRPGDDGPRRDDLHAAHAGLRPSARSPRCCAARAEGDPQAYPVKAAKAPRPRRQGVAYWLEHDGHVLLVRRPAKGLLGGMLALPTDSDGAPAEAGLERGRAASIMSSPISRSP